VARTIGDLLVRAALDDVFRDALEREPDAAMVGYDLTDDERRVLRRRDRELLDLVAAATRAAARTQEAPPLPPPRPAPAPGPTPTLPFPELAFVVRLTPQAVPRPDGTWWVSYQSHISPLSAPPAPAPDASPFGHRLDGDDVAAAITAVAAATPDARGPALLDLIAAVTGQGRADG
jgi:hypothetical protein